MTREEAIEVYNGLINQKIKEAFEFFAPELRESEDERIRKEIVDFLRFTLVDRGIKNGKEKADKWIAYLEKQKGEEGYEAIPIESTLEYKAGFHKGKEEALKELDESGKVHCKSFDKGYDAGKREALKDMPKWKVAKKDEDCDTLDYAILYKHDGGDYKDYYTVEPTNRLKQGDLYLELEELEKLPHEEC